jgi:hypothetical protein
MTDDTPDDKLADDLLFGARAIADEIGGTEDQVYYLKKKKRLPIGKCGKTLISSRKKLRRAAAALTS